MRSIGKSKSRPAPPSGRAAGIREVVGVGVGVGVDVVALGDGELRARRAVRVVPAERRGRRAGGVERRVRPSAARRRRRRGGLSTGIGVDAVRNRAGTQSKRVHTRPSTASTVKSYAVLRVAAPDLEVPHQPRFTGADRQDLEPCIDRRERERGGGEAAIGLPDRPRLRGPRRRPPASPRCPAAAWIAAVASSSGEVVLSAVARRGRKRLFTETMRPWRSRFTCSRPL